MFVTKMLFNQDPSSFIDTNRETIELKFLTIHESDMAGQSVDFYYGGGRKSLNQPDPKLSVRTWHTLDAAKAWINYLKEIVAGTGLTFVVTIEDILWEDDTKSEFLKNPVILETIQSDS
jgi:hypothetical protein